MATKNFKVELLGFNGTILYTLYTKTAREADPYTAVALACYTASISGADLGDLSVNCAARVWEERTVPARTEFVLLD